MRIAIYTLRFNTLSGGGSHHALAANIRAMLAAGHTPTLTTFHSSDNKYAEKPCEMREEEFTGGFIALQRRVAQIMKEASDAHVHVIAGPTLLWGGGMYKRNGGARPVVVSLNNYTPGMGLQRPTLGALHTAKWFVWEKLAGVRLARSIDRAVFDSPVVEKHYRDFGYRFMHGAVTIPDPVERLPAAREASPYPDDPALFHVLFIARLIEDKAPDMCVKAAARLPENIHMHLIGSGSEEGLLRSLIEEHKVGKRVHLHGWKSLRELPAFYQHAHLFVHPCRWPEPFGLVVPEALSFGLPIVVTENTGAAWAAGDAGITFKKDDIAEFSKHILFFYNNPDVRSEYAKKAIARARNFDADAVSRQFVKDIESLVRSAAR